MPGFHLLAKRGNFPIATFVEPAPPNAAVADPTNQDMTTTASTSFITASPVWDKRAYMINEGLKASFFLVGRIDH